MLWMIGVVTLGLAGLLGIYMRGPDLEGRFRAERAAALASDAARPHPVLTEADIADLPAPVQRHIRHAGALGQPRPASVTTRFEAALISAPGARPMTGVALQYNRFDPPKRLFYMESRMGGLPVRVLHDYEGEAARMTVRLAGLVNVVDAGGEAFSRTETVTLLNDLCLLAPGWLADPRLSWTAVDDLTADVVFRNGRHCVSARLVFAPDGRLVNFISQDRGAVQKDGSLTFQTWETPLEGERDFAGQRVFATGQAIWQQKGGPFAYARLTPLALERH